MIYRLLLLTLLLTASADAAEIVLRSEAICAGALVRLDDVAEIYAGDAEQRAALARVELFPTPAAGSRRFVRVREVQDLLTARGVNLAEHRLSGASQVEVASTAAMPAQVGSLTASTERQAASTVASAVVACLQAASARTDTFLVDLKLTPAQSQAVLTAGGVTSVQGGVAPWTGRQDFVITLAGAQAQPFTIETHVSLPPMAVIAVRTVSRGAVVQASDVKLERPRPGVNLGDYCDRLEDVVGREATRTFGEGQFVDRTCVRQPLLVKRGDAVTVYARSAGLRVRTTARARDDGSHGELVTVESMLNRQTFYARVIGIQEVEVYARAPDTSTSAARPTGTVVNASSTVGP